MLCKFQLNGKKKKEGVLVCEALGGRWQGGWTLVVGDLLKAHGSR